MLYALRNNLPLSTLLLYLLLLISCGVKERPVEVKGKIIDRHSNQPLPGRKVEIQATIKEDGEEHEINAGQFVTDSAGSFSYTLVPDKELRLYTFCFVGDSSYAYTTSYLTPYDLRKFGKFLTFRLTRFVDFTINIVRKTRIPFNDTLFVSWESDDIDGRVLYPYSIVNKGIKRNLDLMWLGGEINSTIKTRVYEDKKARVYLDLIRHGKKRGFRDTLTCRRDIVNNISFTY